MTQTLNAKAPLILVVDDLPANVDLLVRKLSNRGYNAQPVISGELALQAARTNPPELILLDINMPQMSGFEVCEQLKLDPALCEIPVIFISALNEEADKLRAFAVGGVDYVTKPFVLSEVYARVETHLKLRSLQRQLTEHNASLQVQVRLATQSLADAYERVQELSRLKDDFFRMISHEMRTPANGVLGLGQLLIGLCPESDKRNLYANLFAQSSDRLVNLLSDVSLLAKLDATAPPAAGDCRFSDLLVAVQNALPGVRVTPDNPAALTDIVLQGSESLLQSSLKTVVLLATCFSVSKTDAQLVCTFDAQRLHMRLDLDALLLSSAQVADFFKLEASVRSSSPAEPMGLSPVVACQTLGMRGGALQLVKGEGAAGYLVASFPRTGTSISGDLA